MASPVIKTSEGLDKVLSGITKQAEAAVEAKPKPLEAPKPNKLASILGQAGAAVMGPFQDSWQARMGGLASQLAQEESYGKVMAHLLEGGDLKGVDTSLLTPDQVNSVLAMKTEVAKASQAGISTLVDNITKIKKLGLDEATTQSLINKAVAESEQIAGENQTRLDIAGIQKEATIESATIGAETDIATTNIREEGANTRMNQQIQASKEELQTRMTGELNQIRQMYGQTPGAAGGLRVLEILAQTGNISLDEFHETAKRFGFKLPELKGVPEVPMSNEFDSLFEESGLGTAPSSGYSTSF